MSALQHELLKGRDPASGQQELNQRIRRHYDRYGDIYDLYQWYFYDWFQQRAWWKEVQWMLKRVSPKPARVLDLGCGTGNLALKFMNEGCQVVGVDISRRVLEVLARKAETQPRGRVELVVANMLEFATSGRSTFDVVCECSVLHHILGYADLVRAMARLVRPGGFLFLTREPFAPGELASIGAVRGMASDVLERFYRHLFVRMSYARRFSHMVPPPDLSRISANFYESGISLERVRAAAAEEGLSQVRLRRWNERETGLLSYLDNRLFRAFRRERFQKAFYSLILERPATS